MTGTLRLSSALQADAGDAVGFIMPGYITFVVDLDCPSAHIFYDRAHLHDVHPCGVQLQAAGRGNLERAK